MVPRVIRIVLAGLLASLLAPALATAAPQISVTASCTYDGGRFAVVGTGFAPNTRIVLQIMPSADPSAGDPLANREATVDANGFLAAVTFDVPPTGSRTPVARAVRVLPGAASSAAPAPLATAPLRSVARSVRVSSERRLSPGTVQRWRLTGLPEGTPLYAHYRRARRTVAVRSIGQASDPCGRLDFTLPVIPRAASGRGTVELWMTADRTFRRPLKGVYVHRRLRVARSTRGARVRAGALKSRLVPLNPLLQSPVTNYMTAYESRIGVVGLTFRGARGSTVEFLERIADRLVPLGTALAKPGEEFTRLAEATTWSCERTERRFVAVATRPEGGLLKGTYSIHTPSCAARFELTSPRRAQPGDVARIRIADGWGIGAITPTLCVTPPRGQRTCRATRLGPGVTVLRRRLRLSTRGDWLVQLRVRDRGVRRAVISVGNGAGTLPVPPTVLATGDSTMQGIDAFLGDELGDAASVVSDVRLGTGISRTGQPGLPDEGNPLALQWGLLAMQQTAQLQPSATVVSVGAGELFPMIVPGGAKVTCCDAPWEAEYSRRVRLMMQTYTRGGLARALWLTIPQPRNDIRRASVLAVNRAIVDAVTGVAGATVLRMDLVFSPDGYSEVIHYRGRDIDVRDPDGVHLNVAGTAIAARIVADALRAGTSSAPPAA